MCLPDEESIIQSLRRIKDQSTPPRQEWKRVGLERLVRKASTVQRRKKAFGTAGYAGTLAATVLMGVWFGSATDQQNDPEQHLSLTITEPNAGDRPSVFPGAASDDRQQAIENRQVETQGLTQTQSLTETRSLTETHRLTGQTASSKESTGTVPNGIKQANRTVQTMAATPSTIAAAGNKTSLEKQAEQYLREQLGEQSGQYQIDPAHSRLSEGSIAFRRVIHGIPLQEKSAVVQVNQFNGEKSLLLYPNVEKSLTLSTLPEQTDVIDKTKAAQELAASLRLVYAGKEPHTLQYMLDQHTFINAKTGERVADQKAEEKVVAVKGQGKRLIAKDGSEATAILREEFGIEVPGEPYLGIDRKSISYHWQQGGKPVAILYTDEAGSFIGYTLNGSLGQEGQPVSSIQQAREIALDQLATYLPRNVEQIAVESASLKSGSAHFTFLPMYQGIPVIDFPFQITVEMVSGMVTKVEGDFSQESFKLPDPAEAIPPAEAIAHFVQEVPVELVYLTTSGDRPLLVYQIRMGSEKPVAIDAKTGRIVE